MCLWGQVHAWGALTREDMVALALALSASTGGCIKCACVAQYGNGLSEDELANQHAKWN